MRVCTFMVACLLLAVTVSAQTSNEEKEVRATIEAFYTAFDMNGFDHAKDFATEDWYHIDPFGGCSKSRDTLLKELTEIHNSFLKGVTDKVEDMSIRFATPDVAVATVTSRMSHWTSPDGVKHVNEGHIRTFVVVKRDGRWLIMQDQNTTIAP
jgi:uncharacterized protein (TIGR02246 family)